MLSLRVPSSSFITAPPTAAPATTRPGQLSTSIATVKQSHHHFGQKHGTAALNALKTQYKTHWREILATGNPVNQVERLLLTLSAKQVRQLTAKGVYQFLQGKINVGLPSVESALTVLRSHVSREHQTLINTTWEKLHCQNEKIGKYSLAMRLQKELGHLELRPAQFRRALLGADDIPDITILSQASVALNIDVKEEEVEWVLQNLQSLRHQYHCQMDLLVALQSLPDYHEMTAMKLFVVMELAEEKMSLPLVKLSQSAFKASPTEEQQQWFDRNWTSSATGTKCDQLINLLCQEPAPAMAVADLWRLLFNARVSMSMSLVRNALKFIVHLKEMVQIHWHMVCPTGNMTQLKQLGMMLFSLKNSNIRPAQALSALKIAGLPAADAELKGLCLSAYKSILLIEELNWIRRVWPPLSMLDVSQQQQLQLLRQQGCPKGMTAARLLRLLWEIGEDISFHDLSAAYGNADVRTP
ncbi:hypothetical protein [Pantoea cypripedii]|uniref:Uncharacterized protein n=2 Tax=Pantoea TaxID=53335 RepID=A0A1X1EJW3_PANCY|nr:hypothetical protein [Pantoea cypripedii]MBP2200350.1 hypothetical protein [Pantoea cypripedii]ORM89123.1 hypothetical protein HA50_20930 [Pantoea cypripedii]